MKVGDIVRWAMPDFFGAPYRKSPSGEIGIIVEMYVGNGANVAWFADDMRVTWIPITELQVISESR